MRALVELASDAAAGPPERFLLPDGPREAAALAVDGAAGVARAAASAASGVLTSVAVVVWAFLSVPFVLAAEPFAALLPAVFVAIAWAAARGLVRACAAGGAAARLRSRSVTLTRDDSKRIAQRAAAAAAGLLRAGGPEQDAAFEGYHRALVSLSRFELAVAQATAADRDRAQLAQDDPLRAVAGQIAQDRAARALTHRAAARQETERLEDGLRACRERPRGS